MIHLRQANALTPTKSKKTSIVLVHRCLAFTRHACPTGASLHQIIQKLMMHIGAVPPEAEPRFFFFKHPDLMFASFEALQYLPATVGQPRCFTNGGFSNEPIHFKITCHQKAAIALSKKIVYNTLDFFRSEECFGALYPHG